MKKFLSAFIVSALAVVAFPAVAQVSVEDDEAIRDQLDVIPRAITIDGVDIEALGGIIAPSVRAEHLQEVRNELEGRFILGYEHRVLSIEQNNDGTVDVRVEFGAAGTNWRLQAKGTYTFVYEAGRWYITDNSVFEKMNSGYIVRKTLTIIAIVFGIIIVLGGAITFYFVRRAQNTFSNAKRNS